MERNRTASFNIGYEWQDWIALEAQRRGVSKSEVVRDALTLFRRSVLPSLDDFGDMVGCKTGEEP